ncbi:MAG: nodulation protein NfeD [Thermoplasmatota archaeon]
MKIAPALIFLFFILLLSNTVIAESNSVLLVEITGTIDQSTVEIIMESSKQAEQKNVEAILLLMDTPGGGLSQTFEIADLIYQSSIPVIGYVYPRGSAAWSAGTFIIMSTHIAAMAEYSIIGSCQPVQISIDGTRLINDSKTINALVEWIQQRADMYNRNRTLAKEFITINRNVNGTVAKQLGVIEVVANSIDQLLFNIHGKNISLLIGNVTLNTANAKQIEYIPSLKIQIHRFLSNPILTSLLLTIGILSLIFGISSPGYGAEVFGVIAILLSLIGSGFSISAMSIIFLIIGCLLLVVEIVVIPGFGVIGIGGMICLIVGSIFLIPSYPTREWLISSDYMIDALMISLVVIALIAIFFLFLLYKVLAIRKKKPTVGTFIGEIAKTIDKIEPDKPGYVIYKGEYWQARADTSIEPQIKVIILEKDGSVLVVKPEE